jgi:hypothetical protein
MTRVQPYGLFIDEEAARRIRGKWLAAPRAMKVLE